MLVCLGEPRLDLSRNLVDQGFGRRNVYQDTTVITFEHLPHSVEGYERLSGTRGSNDEKAFVGINAVKDTSLPPIRLERDSRVRRRVDAPIKVWSTIQQLKVFWLDIDLARGGL